MSIPRRLFRQILFALNYVKTYCSDPRATGYAPIKKSEIPTSVYTAGKIWTIIGVLILINLVANLVWGNTLDRQQQQAEYSGFTVCVLWISAGFGAVFIHVGQQTTKGLAIDTLGNAIGSIIFGLLNGGFGGLTLVRAAVAFDHIPLKIVISGSVGLLAGLGLLAAGVLALVGRDAYLTWRREKTRKPDDIRR